MSLRPYRQESGQLINSEPRNNRFETKGPGRVDGDDFFFI